MARSNYWDLARGLAMFLVVVGHTYLRTSQSLLFIAIMSFHMPLFMLISGYFFAKSQTKHNSWELFIKKSKQLLLPVLLCGTVYFFFINDWMLTLHEQALFYYGTLIRTLWFLPAVFFSIVIVLSIDKLISKEIVRLLSYCIVCVSFLFFPDFANSTGCKFMFPCFIVGMSLSRYPNIILFYKAHRHASFIVLLLIYLVLFQYEDFTKTFYNTTIYAFKDGVWDWSIGDNDIFRVVIGVIGSLLVLVILQLLSRVIQMD